MLPPSDVNETRRVVVDIVDGVAGNDFKKREHRWNSSGQEEGLCATQRSRPPHCGC